MSVDLTKPELLPCLAQGFVVTDSPGYLSEDDLEAFVTGDVPEENYISLDLPSEKYLHFEMRELLAKGQHCSVDVVVVGVLERTKGKLHDPYNLLFKVSGGADGLSLFIQWYFGISPLTREELAKTLIMRDQVGTPIASVGTTGPWSEGLWIPLSEALVADKKQLQQNEASRNKWKGI